MKGKKPNKRPIGLPNQRPIGLHKERNPFVVSMLARGHQVHEKTTKAKRKATKQSLDKLTESDYK